MYKEIAKYLIDCPVSHSSDTHTSLITIRLFVSNDERFMELNSDKDDLKVVVPLDNIAHDLKKALRR